MSKRLTHDELVERTSFVIGRRLDALEDLQPIEIEALLHSLLKDTHLRIKESPDGNGGTVLYNDDPIMLLECGQDMRKDGRPIIWTVQAMWIAEDIEGGKKPPVVHQDKAMRLTREEFERLK